VPHVDVHLNARLQPMHRGERYEDPLEQVFARLAPGSEVVGGGTLASPEGEPLSCDIELHLTDEGVAHGQELMAALESLGAPRGSTWTVGDEPPVPFGASEGVAVYLNGTDLPDEVYRGNDVNDLIGQLLDRVGDEGDLHSWWEGPRESALYLYGRSAAVIKDRSADVLAVHPLAQRCRVVDLT
jgi:hypothetical protein